MKTCIKAAASFLLASALTAANSGDIGLTLGLENKVGLGTFLPRDRAQDQLISTFGLTPFIMLGPLYADKKLKISAEQKMDVEWLESKSNPKRTLSFNDLIFRASIKNALEWPTTGLSLTPTLENEFPLSEGSVATNRLIGFGANTILTWTQGGLSLRYKPSLSGYVHHTAGTNTPSQQTMAMLKNTVGATYAMGNHSININFRTYHAFMRQLALADSSLRISTLGYIEYVYALPLSFPVSLTVGLSSLQPLRNASGKINFPFFDFFTPANNYTQFYCNFEAMIS